MQMQGPDLGSQNPCQRAKRNGRYLWSPCWRGGDRQVLEAQQPASLAAEVPSLHKCIHTLTLLYKHKEKKCEFWVICGPFY